MENCSVLIYHQTVEKTTALLHWGRCLTEKNGGKLGVLMVDATAETIRAIPADVIYTVSTEKNLFPEEYAGLLEKAVQKIMPAVVLGAATKLGNEVAARAAELLQIGCISECQQVMIGDDQKLQAKRALYGGVAIGVFEAEQSPCICTMALGALDQEAVPMVDSQIIALEISCDAVPKKVLDIRPIEKTIDLTKAKRIVSMGRGIAKQGDIGMVEELAQAFEAEMGCSRPIAEELKWLPDERKVGITGALVKPDLYLALGISGQIQHFAGMKDSKIIVAVNSNKMAPIFSFCDYGIVGDVYKMIPALQKAIRG